MPDIYVLTFNCRGLRKMTKRRALFRHMHQYYPKHIVVLQETHSAPRDVSYWQAEWGAPVFFSHGQSTGECGVAVLIPKSIAGSCDVTLCHSDDSGRLLRLELAFEQFVLSLIAVYAPTQGHMQQQLSFLEKMKKQLEDISDLGYTMVCGDFNLHLSKLDIQGRNFHLSQSAKRLKDLLAEYNLVDAWRERNETRRRYTWRRLRPLQQSRIDYVFLSDTLIRNHVVERIDIKPGIMSDHSLVHVDMIVFGTEKGRGLFRFDNKLLEDEDFVQQVRREISKANSREEIYADAHSPGLRLEMLFSEIRVKSSRMARLRAKERRDERRALIETLDNCERELGSGSSEELVAQYDAARQRLDQIEEEQGRLAMIRSGARWLEEGEKPTKYFLRLNARRNKEKQINVLQADDDSLITGRRDILNYCKKYFEAVYRSKAQGSSCVQMTNYFDKFTCPQLSENDSRSCDGDLSIQECEIALKGMLNNKAPSVSGFSKEFVLFFWTELGQLIVTYINTAREQGEFFVTQRRGVLTLLPKKGDQKLIKNKRAICLLDIIYKIAAKAIANRLMAVLPTIVASDQTGSVRGRYIGSSLRTIEDIIFYCAADRLNGILMALDFKNAFNTVEHDFLYSALKKFNFGENFIDWIRLLHNHSELTVINNGFTSEWFQPSRGLQQGCPASAPLFALVVEMLALRIRGEEGIHGLSISGKSVKMTHYCDDTTLFVRDESDAMRAIELVREFGEVSGLELNMSKSEFMWLGKQKGSEQTICGYSPVEKIKILGIWFSSSIDCSSLNTEVVESKIKSTLNDWKQRDLSIKGRVTVVKSLIVSQFVYIMAAIRVEQKTLFNIQSHIMKFLWRGRPPKVAKASLMKGIEEGGLSVPELSLMNKANRIAWFGRILKQPDSVFALILRKRLRVSFNLVLRANFDDYWINTRQIPHFYKEMFRWYKELGIQMPPTTPVAIRQQPLWHNKAVSVQGRTLISNAKIETELSQIEDVVSGDGHIMAYMDFSERHPSIKINPLSYMSWCQSIPRHWRDTLLGSSSLSPEERCEKAKVMIKGKEIELELLKSGHFYSLLRLGTNVTPTSQMRWVEKGFVPPDWGKVYKRSFKITTSTKLQSLQFRILHRYFSTKTFLFARHVTTDPFCDNCGMLDTLQHYFFDCALVQSLWINIALKVNARGIAVQFSQKDVLFGSDRFPDVINLIILVAKQFIVHENCRDGDKDITAFKEALSKIFYMERYIAKKNGNIEKFKLRWAPFVCGSDLLQFEWPL